MVSFKSKMFALIEDVPEEVDRGYLPDRFDVVAELFMSSDDGLTWKEVQGNAKAIQHKFKVVVDTAGDRLMMCSSEYMRSSAVLYESIDGVQWCEFRRTCLPVSDLICHETLTEVDALSQPRLVFLNPQPEPSEAGQELRRSVLVLINPPPPPPDQ